MRITGKCGIYSPNLNSIEHLCDELGRRIAVRRKRPTVRQALIQALQRKFYTSGMHLQVDTKFYRNAKFVFRNSGVTTVLRMIVF